MDFSPCDLKKVHKTVRPLCRKVIKNLEIEIEVQKNKCSRIEDKYIEELICKEVYERNRAKACRKIDSLQVNLNKLTVINKEYSIYLEKVMKILTNLSHSYQHSTVSNRVKLLKLILTDKIVYNGDRIIDAPLTELVSFLQNPNKLLAIIESTSGQTKTMTDIILAIFDNLYSCYHNKVICFEK